MSSLSQRLREPLVLAILVIAVAGWVAFLAIWFNSSQQSGEYQQSISALTTERDSTVASLEEQVATNGALAETQAALSKARQDLAAATASTENVNSELATRQEELDTASTALEERLAEANAARQLQADANAEAEALAARQQEVTLQLETADQQLTDVGARLEQVRNDEAEATARSAQLAEEAAVATANLADIQSQLQTARVDLAAVQQQTADATAQNETAGADLQALQQQVTDLGSRSGQLAQEVAGYEEQRDELQPQVEALAAAVTARGNELTALEASIGDASRAADASTSTGIFIAGEDGAAPGLTLLLDGDERFTLTGADMRAVEGSYVLSETELVLSEATGAIGAATFPMTCPISRTGTTLTIGEAEGCLIAGIRFDRRR